MLKENVLIEAMPPGLARRSLSPEEVDEDRRPMVMLTGVRERPLDGSPAGVAGRLETYGSWLRARPASKLFIDAKPGVLMTGAVRELCHTFLNQEEASARGMHFIQKDDPDAVGTGPSPGSGSLADRDAGIRHGSAHCRRREAVLTGTSHHGGG